MTSPPSPPNRRRRRIVVVTIAVLVVGLGWWCWPRVDQRFVGTWVEQDSSLPTIYEFKATGLGKHTITFPNDPGLPPYVRYFTWSVDQNDILVTYHHLPAEIGELFSKPGRTASMVMGVTVRLTVTDWSVDSFAFSEPDTFCSFIGPTTISTKLSRAVP